MLKKKISLIKLKIVVEKGGEKKFKQIIILKFFLVFKLLVVV